METKNMLASNPSDVLVGEIIDGKYRIEKLIGVGGMGRVFRGVNIRTDSPVAIKTLNPDMTTDENVAQRFEIEAKAASNLRHPNTIQIYDFGTERGMLFMVMELLVGEALEDRLRRERQIDAQKAVALICQACGALEEAHENGLVHRDLKPDNLFLCNLGEQGDFVKVLDFGVAKLRKGQYGSTTLTQAGMIFGTPRYMSPEQARGAALDGRSDIYALGVILYEMLTGVPPFDADEPMALLLKHVTEPAPSFAQVAPTLPSHPALEQVVLSCLSKEVDGRPESVSALARALRQAIGLERNGATRGVVHGAPATQPHGNDTLMAAEVGATLMDQPPVTGEGGAEGYSLDMSTGRHDAQLETRQYARSASSSVPKGLVIGAAALILALGGGIAMLLNEKAETEAAESAARALLVSHDQAVEAGTEITDASLQSAEQEAQTRTMNLQLRSSLGEGIEVTMSRQGHDPVTLPHVIPMLRAEEETVLLFTASAEGYQDATIEVPVGPDADEVFVVSLEPQRARQVRYEAEEEGREERGSSDREERREEPRPERTTRPVENVAGGLENPYL